MSFTKHGKLTLAFGSKKRNCGTLLTECYGHHRYFHISSAIEANPTAVSGGDTYAGSTFVL